MPWKERYTISDEKSLADDEISLAAGCLAAASPSSSISVSRPGRKAFARPTCKTPEAEFGANHGLAVCSPCWSATT